MDVCCQHEHSQRLAGSSLQVNPYPSKWTLIPPSGPSPLQVDPYEDDSSEGARLLGSEEVVHCAFSSSSGTSIGYLKAFRMESVPGPCGPSCEQERDPRVAVRVNRVWLLLLCLSYPSKRSAFTQQGKGKKKKKAWRSTRPAFASHRLTVCDPRLDRPAAP